MKITLSIIIPTRNRSRVLRDALQSLVVGCQGAGGVECIVVDNGSTDDTKQMVEAFAASAPFMVRYEYAPCPGLHVGRNRGAELASGDLLAYLDDDVIVNEGWADALIRRFSSDERIVFVGGPCRPKWEAEPPQWVSLFRQSLYGGWLIGQLGLLDLGESAQEVSADYIFGGNCGIRKNVLMALGGFHPDALPAELLAYRGDGETGMGLMIKQQKDMLVLYDPAVAILHRVPKERLTKEFFLSIARRMGISTAYTVYRSTHGDLKPAVSQFLRLLKDLVIFHKQQVLHKDSSRTFFSEWERVYLRATAGHYMHILCSGVLRRWVLQPRYFSNDPCPYWGA